MSDLAAAISAEEARLRAARDEAFEQAKLHPTVANRKVYRQALSALEEFLAAQADTTGEQVFENIPALVAALDVGGWKISVSTAYEHRDQGKLKLRGDGTITETMATDYARTHLRRKDGTRGPAEDLQADKARADIRRIQADAEQRELKLDLLRGNVIMRSQVEIELAERATSLRTYLDAVARGSAGRIVKLVGGDPQKVPDLVAFLLGVNRKAMDNYSRPIVGFEESEEE